METLNMKQMSVITGGSCENRSFFAVVGCMTARVVSWADGLGGSGGAVCGKAAGYCTRIP